MTKNMCFFPEVRQRAVRMVLEGQDCYDFLLTDFQQANWLDVGERTILKLQSDQTRMVFTTWCCLCWLAGLGMPLDNQLSG
ncbi:hypothetical protein D3C81_634980 [compost metagenome]